jgi:hypothetical protein
MRSIPPVVLDAVVGGNLLEGLGTGGSGFADAIQSQLGQFRASASTNDLMDLSALRGNAKLTADAAQGKSVLGSRGW